MAVRLPDLEKIISDRGQKLLDRFRRVGVRNRRTKGRPGEVFLKDVEPEDLLAVWIDSRNLLGGFRSWRHLQDLDNEPLLFKILTEPKNALVKQYQRLFDMEERRIGVCIDDAFIGDCRRKRLNRKTGAHAVFDPSWKAILLETMYDLPSLDGVQEVVINGRCGRGDVATPLHIYADRQEEVTAPAS